RRHSYPLVDLSMFRFRVFALGQFVALFGLTAISTHDFLMPFFWQGARGFAAQEAGLMLIPFSAGIFSGAPLAGRMIHRFGARSLMAVGLVFVIVGLALISQLTVHSSIPDVVWRSWLCGFGFGMYFTPNNHIIMSAIPSWQRGVASGVLGMFRMIGAAVGTAVSGTIVAIIVTNRFEGLSGSLVTKQDFALAASDPQRLERLNNAFSDGFQAAFLVALAFVTIALLLTIMLPSRIEEPEEAEETQILQMERADASSLPQPAQSES
ncbi:MAG TPA: MFS transporter, partial [Dehalococcoidia bacterium]|nr:MFS transporter [Dehalococcoidia bacterium]